MNARNVARALTTLALAGALAAAGSMPALAAPSGDHPGRLAESYPLPTGYQPEGIAIDARGTAYVGSLADGSIRGIDLRTGESELVSPAVGSPSVGLKVDRFDHLFVAGGPSGTARVVDTTSGEVLAEYALGAGFINDVAITTDSAWFTNSAAAELYRIPLGANGSLPEQSDVETLALGGDWQQQPGFNANGIAVTPDGSALLVVQSSTATLYRVDPTTGDATAVDLGGESLTFGDGLLTVGNRLYAVQNRLGIVSEFRLAPDGTSGTLLDRITSPLFDVPTTVAAYRDSLFLPNARFGTPDPANAAYDVIRVER